MESSESSTPQKESKSKNSHPRRFSDEQIKSLESIFKQETKLEPRKKVQIARDLCLEPKQVAIWFQNKRARWKSKQLEQQFNLLKSNYDALLIKFDDLKREKHSLQMQLQELNDRCCSSKNDDDVMVSGDDERIVTSCFENTIKDQDLVRWSNGEEEEEMSNLSLFDENFEWWES